MIICEKQLKVTDEMITLQSPFPLKTISSGVAGAGVGSYQTFVNRHVDHNYDCDDFKREMADYLLRHRFQPAETVGMMTAVQLKHVAYQLFEEAHFSVFIVVTAGVGNAVDATTGEQHQLSLSPGTINTWVFVNGQLSDEAFVQCVMTATEAKVKALHTLKVIDPRSETLATGTSTDSILIAATQKGKTLSFGGSITPLGRLVGKGVFLCTKEALRRSSS